MACLGLEALSLWWQIQLDPESLRLDAPFMAKVNAAIAEAERMTKAEPQRAEAWFYLGAAYGVRAQFRVHRVERLAAARDGKRIKASLDRALALDPAMHDAEFGIGMYRYYADIAPAIFRFLRFLLLMPGGDRVDGLRQLERAATRGILVRGEALYQIHVIYLWYEKKWPQALDDHPHAAVAVPEEPAVPPDRGGDPRRLLPRRRRQPQRRRSSCSRSRRPARCIAPTSRRWPRGSTSRSN